MATSATDTTFEGHYSVEELGEQANRATDGRVLNLKENQDSGVARAATAFREELGHHRITSARCGELHTKIGKLIVERDLWPPLVHGVVWLVTGMLRWGRHKLLDTPVLRLAVDR